jgi:hypothetical protein
LGLEVARCDLALDIAVVRAGVSRSRDDDDGIGGDECDLDKLSHVSLLGIEEKALSGANDIWTQDHGFLFPDASCRFLIFRDQKNRGWGSFFKNDPAPPPA